MEDAWGVNVGGGEGVIEGVEAGVGVFVDVGLVLGGREGWASAGAD